MVPLGTLCVIRKIRCSSVHCSMSTEMALYTRTSITLISPSQQLWCHVLSIQGMSASRWSYISFLNLMVSDTKCFGYCHLAPGLWYLSYHHWEKYNYFLDLIVSFWSKIMKLIVQKFYNKYVSVQIWFFKILDK